MEYSDIKYREILIEIANDWTNNYLTVDVFAEHNGLTASHAKQLIDLARAVRQENAHVDY